MRRIWTALAAIPLLISAAAPAAANPLAEAPSGHFTGTLADGSTWIADVPANWNGTLLLYSHGFGPLVPQNAPSEEAGKALLARGYALAGSSYAPGSWWALGSAVRDQLGTAKALSGIVGKPRRTIAVGTSMGGLVSALLAETGRVNGVLTTCGIVAGGVDLNNYQLNAIYALAELLAPGENIKLTGFTSPAEGAATGQRLTELVQQAQATPQGRARIALASAFLNQADWYPGQTKPAPGDYAGQEEQQYQWLTSGGVLNFIMFGRYWIENAAGGDSAWNAGLDYKRLLRGSVHLPQVRALYKTAGASLTADLTTLTRNASTKADLDALDWMKRTSVTTGKVRVPELAIHTISDQLVPVEQQTRYAARVRAADRTGLLRQAYVDRAGHCSFTTAELVASVEAVGHRVATGHWGHVATPAALNRAASAIGESAFIPYRPAPLVVQPATPR